jgi:beta-hydroxylase
MNAISDRDLADDGRSKPVAPPRQEWTTPGIAAMDRPGTFAQLLLSAVAFAERLNVRKARLGNPPVYDNVQFPWVDGLEREWRTIRSDLDRVLARKNDLPNIQDITPDARAITSDDGWKTFIFIAYGVKSPPNIALCPKTWRALGKIPGLKTAMFSIFEPGKRLRPHRGPYNGVLRLHLGLKVPLPRDSAMIRIATRGSDRCKLVGARCHRPCLRSVVRG